VTALAFDPWAALKCNADAQPPANPAKPANPPTPISNVSTISMGAATNFSFAPAEAAPGPGPGRGVEGDMAAMRTTCVGRTAALTGAFDDPGVLVYREAIATDVWPSPLPPSEPPAGLVERLARAMATPRPWQRVTDPQRGLAYFRGQARRRLTAIDPIARGLLVQAEEAAARRHGGRAR